MRSWKLFSAGLCLLGAAVPCAFHPLTGFAAVVLVLFGVVCMQAGEIRREDERTGILQAEVAVLDLCPDDIVKLSQGRVRARFGVHWLTFRWDATHHCLEQVR